MADPRYAIDGPVAPDLTPGISMFLAARNQHRANKRSDEYLQMERDAMKRNAERQSAQDVRDKEERDRKHAIEAGAAFSTAARAARNSVGMGNMIGSPYGIKFDETRDLPANVEGPQLSPEAEAARFTPSPHETTPAAPPTEQGPDVPPEAFFTDSGGPGGPPAPPAETPARPMTPTGYEAGAGIGAFGDEQRQAAADNLKSVGTGLHGPDALATPDFSSPPLDLKSQAAANAAGMQAPGPEGTRRLMASYQGNSFEVPAESEKTPFGAEYDAIYKGLLDAGEDPHKAMKVVADEYKAAQAQKAMGDRIASQIDSRRDLQGNRQDFQRGENEKYRETHAGRDELIDRAGKYKVAAASPGLKADAANSRDMSILRQQGAAIRNTSQFGKLAANDKTVRGLMANIATGAVPLAHADAQIQLARFFRQAQPTEGEMHMLYNNLGGTADKWNQFVARMSKGDLSAEQMRQLRASAKTVQHEHEQDKQRFADVARHMLGPGSGFDNMPDQAQQLYEGMGAELGIKDLPPLYGTEGGVTLGSGKRPTVAPRGTKKTQLDEIESYLDSLGGQGGR